MSALASFVALLALSCISAAAHAQTCTALSTGTWLAAARWSCTLPTANRIPLSTDNVVIGNFDITVDTGNAVAASVSLASGNNNGSLTINGGRSLGVTGTVNLSASTLVGSGRAKAITVAGTLTAASMTIDGQGSNTRQAQLIINNGLVDINGSVTVTANTDSLILFCTSATCGATAGGALNVAGDLGSGAQFNAGSGTVNYDGTGAQDVGTYAYNNLTVTKSSGTAALLATVTVAGNLTVTCPAACTNGTFDLSNFTADRTAAGGTISVGAGSLLLIGGTNTFPANYTTHTLSATSTVEYDGTAQTIAAENYGSLTISGARGASSVTLANTGTIGVAGTFSPTATFSSGAYVIAGSSVNFNGTGAQTVPAFSYNNLTLSGARTTNSVTLVNGGTINVAGAFTPSATFSSGGYVVTGNTVTFNAGGAQTVPAFNYNNLTISGARTTNSVTLANGGTVGVAGAFTPGATFTSGGYVVTNNTVEYNGSAAQTLNAFGFANLRINNGNGVTLSAGNATVSGTLTLTTGIVTTTGTNTVITTASCAAPSVSRASGHIAGRLQKAIPTGASSCLFEIGGSTAADYTPVQTSYAAVTGTGNVLALVTAGDHPSLSGSGIDTTQSVNRYWTVASPVTGALPTAAAGATYDAQFNFVPAVAGEVDAGANAMTFVVKRFASSTWSAVALGTRTATSTTGTTLLLTAGYGDFALGAPSPTNFTREQQFIYTRELY